MIIIIHCMSLEVDGVPGPCFKSDFTPPSGVYTATAAPKGGVVLRLFQLITVEVDVAIVKLPVVHPRPHADGHTPGSRHRHSEEP